MMIQAMRSIVAAGLFVGLGLVGQLATPPCALACSCAFDQPEGVAETVQLLESEHDATVVVVAGTVGARTRVAQLELGEVPVHDFVVSSWHYGASPIGRFDIAGSTGADCGLGIEVGQELILVATIRDGRLLPSFCFPAAVLGTPEAEALAAEAVAAFGPEIVPDPIEPAPPAVSESMGLGFVAVLGVILAGGAVLLALYRRRPT